MQGTTELIRKNILPEVGGIRFGTGFSESQGFVNGALNALLDCLQFPTVRQFMFSDESLELFDRIPGRPKLFFFRGSQFIGIGQGVAPEAIGQSLN